MMSTTIAMENPEIKNRTLQTSPQMKGRKIAVVAIGGNAVIKSNRESEAHHEYQAVNQSARHVVDLIEDGWSVVLTHGNGPQVGLIMRRSELARSEVPEVPLEVAVGCTQGSIGYMFQNALDNELSRRGIRGIRAMAMITQTLIDSLDPAFGAPDKPIGAHMEKDVAEKLAAEQGWRISEDSGRGWRRVVASPKPLKIIESPVIRRLLDLNTLVIACGGGGIPVTLEKDGTLHSAQAVIDKDRAAALLAIELQADMLLISTGVDQVAIDFGTPQQRWLDKLDLAEAEGFLNDGQFGVGSMGPKVESMLTYLRACPDGFGLITSLNAMGKAARGDGGTRFVNHIQ